MLNKRRIGANPQRQNRNYNERKPEVFPKAAHSSQFNLAQPNNRATGKD